ncbi:3-methyl-2-oxobutanoate hydroxymethyltransferase [Candidatus Acetothermia bacterium]|nr:3-methyl-2-oxobutanoate hydroxymethyltransferase [Candidatus Acetothermia bacterium]MBI3643061.1 3-methyl-2-oxobutanoate hydroxymethyltransferase [Candidatus Acetothermia bacterium]
MKEIKRIRIPYLLEMKERGEKISMITAYDHPTALLVDRAGIEIVLVGDSVGNNVLGYEETVPVTMEEMIHHTKAVRRGVKRALLIGDMPFMSFNVSNEKAIENAGRFIKEAGADAVKLEGGEEMADRVEALDRAGIAVMGHLGFTPQRISQLGGHKVQGRTEAVAKKLLADAKLLEEAGAFSLILELVPWQIAQLVTASVKIPTIGIGAGPHCDGQVLVLHDVLGFSQPLTKFPKRYVNLNEIIEKALLEFKSDIKSEKYPTIEEHSFSVDEEVLKRLKK